MGIRYELYGIRSSIEHTKKQAKYYWVKLLGQTDG